MNTVWSWLERDDSLMAEINRKAAKRVRMMAIQEQAKRKVERFILKAELEQKGLERRR